MHYDRAGNPDKAIPYYHKAGAAAVKVYANEEAIALFNRGLELLQQIPLVRNAILRNWICFRHHPTLPPYERLDSTGTGASVKPRAGSM